MLADNRGLSPISSMSLWLLYEAGIVVSVWVAPKKKAETQA
jgi:Sec-independent protein secretion pathway component TatC